MCVSAREMLHLPAQRTLREVETSQKGELYILNMNTKLCIRLVFASAIFSNNDSVVQCPDGDLIK